MVVQSRFSNLHILMETNLNEANYKINIKIAGRVNYKIEM